MEQYEIRFLDGANVLVLVRRILARNDDAAMAEANSNSPTHTLEVWKQGRLVGRIERPLSRRTVSR
jgi:hypothetical protein